MPRRVVKEKRRRSGEIESAHLSLPAGNGLLYACTGNGKGDRCERRQFRDETIVSYKGVCGAVVAAVATAAATVAAAVVATTVITSSKREERKGTRGRYSGTGVSLRNRRYKLTIARTTATAARGRVWPSRIRERRDGGAYFSRPALRVIRVGVRTRVPASRGNDRP